MSRAVVAAVSEVHALAMRLRLAQHLGRDDAARLAAARAVLGDDHDLAAAVDYFLRVCRDDRGAVSRQAQRLHDAVRAYVAPAPVRRDLGQIYG